MKVLGIANLLFRVKGLGLTDHGFLVSKNKLRCRVQRMGYMFGYGFRYKGNRGSI